LKADENALRVGEVSDDPPERLWEAADEGGDGENIVALS
jgi:hypothetical protein